MKNSFLLLLHVILLHVSVSHSFLAIVPCKKRVTTTRTLLSTKAPENQFATSSERFNARWNTMFERLKEYKDEYGDCLVPQRYKEDPQLGSWVAKQRQESTLDDQLKQERRDKLNSIGFVWSVQNRGRSSKLDTMWNGKFERLVQYKKRYGDCLVPYHYKEDPSLGRWVSRQRSYGANNYLRADRKTKLESIGFVWVAGESLTAYVEQWEVMFAKLEEYRELYGDCLVPKDYKDDPSLGLWVMTQRSCRDALDPTRRERLESIGFVWQATRGPRVVSRSIDNSGTKPSKLLLRSSLKEPHDSNFGRREYWNEFYSGEQEFSWYTGWQDLEPFVRELVPCETLHILIPGIGNDGAIVDMYDAGYRNLTAFDYAKAGVECSRKLLGDDRIREEGAKDSPGVTLMVADARNLPFEDSSFHAVLDKGTLDAIYLAGGRDKKLAAEYLNMAVSELSRVLTKDGIVISVTAACTDAIQLAFKSFEDWKQVRDGTPYITEDGFASNNVDGTLLAWTIVKK